MATIVGTGGQGNGEIIELMTEKDPMALAYLIDYFLRVIDRNTQPGKYRELVSCLDSSFFTSKWKRTH